MVLAEHKFYRWNSQVTINFQKQKGNEKELNAEFVKSWIFLVILLIDMVLKNIKFCWAMTSEMEFDHERIANLAIFNSSEENTLG